MTISTTQLFRIMKSKGKPVTCHWCEIELDSPLDTHSDRHATRDHISPRRIDPRGSSNKGRAVVLACYRCNQVRGSMEVLQWVEFMRFYPTFRQMLGTPELTQAKKSFELAYIADTKPKIIEGQSA
jgi:hypothetical protein